MGRTRRRRRRKGNVSTCDTRDVINLMKWLHLKGTNLQIRYYSDTGRGVRSKKGIQAGDVLVSIPMRFVITQSVFSEALLLVDRSQLSTQLILSIFLIEEEVETLPQYMRHLIEQKKEDLRMQYKIVMTLYSSSICRHCREDLCKIFHYDLFVWAWFTDEKYDSMALVPLLDMFNHSSNADIEVTVDHKKLLYTVKSLKQHKKKEQIFIKYGPHSNQQLLLEYGFIVPNNSHDIIEFTYEEVMTSLVAYNPIYGELNKLKYKFIQQNNLNKNLTKNKEEFSWNINALLYIFVTNDENLSLLCAKCYSNEFSKFEYDEINAIKKILTKSKRDELTGSLRRMESVNEPTQSISLAKALLTIYIEMLK